MEKKFGNIELGGTFGGYEIVNLPATKLPQDVASAVGVVNSTPLLGATYNPIWYVGKQTVNGVNHIFVAEDIRATKNKDVSIVGLVINVPPGENAFNGEGAKVVRIIESEELAPEVQAAFADAEKHLIGVSYKPVLYIGSQVVRGANHYIVCEAKGIYPGAQPYAAVICLNIFEGKASVVGIAPISPGEKENLCGYSFTW
ncbi:MAG: hypothetical protein IJT01_08325 [Selenomonadaceae bacterium]|nr:hypothetical protein [Selenomonadaceae bacterium]